MADFLQVHEAEITSANEESADDETQTRMAHNRETKNNCQRENLSSTLSPEDEDRGKDGNGELHELLLKPLKMPGAPQTPVFDMKQTYATAMTGNSRNTKGTVIATNNAPLNQGVTIQDADLRQLVEKGMPLALPSLNIHHFYADTAYFQEMTTKSSSGEQTLSIEPSSSRPPVSSKSELFSQRSRYIMSPSVEQQTSNIQPSFYGTLDCSEGKWDIVSPSVEQQISSKNTLANSVNVAINFSNSTNINVIGVTGEDPVFMFGDITRSALIEKTVCNAKSKVRTYGVVYITGSGKTTVAMNLLKEFDSMGYNTVLIQNATELSALCLAYQTNNDVIFIKNIFKGTFALHCSANDWLEKLLQVTKLRKRPFIILTSQYSLAAFECLAQYLHLDSETYLCLDQIDYPESEMKQSLQLANLDMQEQDIVKISKLKLVLPLPYMLKFFGQHKNVQKRGFAFFEKSYECYIKKIAKLERNDPLAYYSLMVVFMLKGSLSVKYLKVLNTSAEFESLCHRVLELCHLQFCPRKLQLKEKIESLVGVFFEKTKTDYTFLNQVIHSSVFFVVFSKDVGVSLSVCTTEMISDFVRSKHVETTDHEKVVCVQDEGYDILAERIIQILLSDEIEDIIDHPIFGDEEFSKHFCQKLSEDESVRIYEKSLKKKKIILAESKEESCAPDPNSVISYTYVLPCLMLKGIKPLLQHSDHYIQSLKSSGKENRELLLQTLRCAIFTGNDITVTKLLNKGIVPDEECFKALNNSQKTMHLYTIQHLEKLRKPTFIQGLSKILTDVFAIIFGYMEY